MAGEPHIIVDLSTLDKAGGSSKKGNQVAPSRLNEGCGLNPFQTSLEILTDILVPLSHLTFHSFNKDPKWRRWLGVPNQNGCRLEVRDISGRTLFRIVSEQASGSGCRESQVIHKLIDYSSQRVLIIVDAVKDSFRPKFRVTLQWPIPMTMPGQTATTTLADLEDLEILHISVPDICSRGLEYEITEKTEIWPTLSLSNIGLDKDQGGDRPLISIKTSAYGCFRHFGLIKFLDDQQGGCCVGELRKYHEVEGKEKSPKSSAKSSSIVEFQRDLPIYEKVGILFTSWHIHAHNFSRSGVGNWGICGWSCLLTVFIVVIIFIFFYLINSCSAGSASVPSLFN